METTKELAPGITVMIRNETPEEAAIKQAEINIAQRLALEAEQREAMKQSVLNKARISLLQNGESFDITDEMGELGIDAEIRAMQLQADMIWSVGRLIFSEDDGF